MAFCKMFVMSVFNVSHFQFFIDLGAVVFQTTLAGYGFHPGPVFFYLGFQLRSLSELLKDLEGGVLNLVLAFSSCF